VLVVTTFALDSEFAAWRRLRPFRRIDGPVPTYDTRIDRVHLRVVLTGIGSEAATAAADTIFREKPDLCITSGLAGGLSETLRVADVVAADRVSGPTGASIACNPPALTLALECGARRIHALYSAPAIVITAEEKRQLSAIGEAVDMESRTILGESQQRNIPALALRAISDTATFDLPLDLNRALSPQGKIDRSRVLAAVVRRPTALPGLVRLGILGYRAATALAVCLDAFVAHLAANAPRTAAHSQQRVQIAEFGVQNSKNKSKSEL
jgi:adenosylhomocysteine nucleosidase